MKNRSKKLLFALMLTVSVAMLATGCDKLKKTPETESETEAPTEKPTETEKQTEKPTEKPTEKQTETEPPTESETQPKELTVEEEKAQETEFDQLRTLYAKDDINIRATPGKDGEVFASFDQGQKITVVGETPNWYKVDVDDYDDNGYVSKEFVSDTEVAPKTDEERANLGNETAADGTSTGNTDTAATASDSGSAAVDEEYGVMTYADQFQISATTGANMRTTPTQDGEIVDTIASGTTVTAVGYTDRWYKVSYNGTTGYVNKNLFAGE